MMAGMGIYLDDQAVLLEGRTLGAVLESARQRLHLRGRMVVEVCLDGQPLLGSALQAQSEMPVGMSDLRLYSAHPHELAATTLQQVVEQLNEVRQVHTQAAELFQSDEASKAMPLLGQAMEQWTHAPVAVVRTAELLGLATNQPLVEGVSIDQAASELALQLRQLRDQVAAGDVVALGDAMAYEWTATADRWTALVRAMLSLIESSPN